MRAVHQPVRDLLQLFQKCGSSRRQRSVCRDHAAGKKKTMPNLQVVLRTKGKEPALLPGLRRHSETEESRRALAQKTGGKSLVRLEQAEMREIPEKTATGIEAFY